MKDNIITISNISKQYRLGLVGTGTLSHDVNRWWHKIRGLEDPYLKIGEINDRESKGNSDYIWALKNINIEVKQGDILGIVGKNGAGKSTLLKLLSRVTAPTTGTIVAHGRIASLLEVGTGFHPELTGRENVFLNGAILGMSKSEIRSKFDEIVEFAGCTRYIDTPVKRYSSGMYVRLAFAVAAHLEPEILVVDEVLAVGDAEFQKKAVGKMKDVSENEGRTVLFVSHNMASVKTLCNRGVLLKNGSICYEGTSNEVVDFYLKDNRADSPEREWKGKGLPLPDEIYLKSIKACSNHIDQSIFPTDKEMYVDITFYKGKTPLNRYDFTLQLKDSNEQILFPVASSLYDPVIPDDAGEYKVRCVFPKNLFNIGDFQFNLILVKNRNQGIHVLENVLSMGYSAPTLEIGSYTQKIEGFLRPHFKWSLL